MLLRLNLPEDSKGFVREHAICSPKEFREKYQSDLSFEVYAGKVPVSDPRVEETLISYWNAVVPLSEYRGDFKVPEIWIPEEIGLADVRKVAFQRRQR